MTLAEQQQGRLEQTCPACGLQEAAGSYCSRCVTRTGPDHWHPAVRTEAQKAATDRLTHSNAERAVGAKKTAIPVAVTAARAPRPVPHSELASAVGPSADRGDVGAGPSEAAEVQAGRLPPVPVADIPPGGGRPDTGVAR